MTVLDLRAALKHEIQTWYPQFPVEALETGLLSPTSVAYWLSTGKSVQQIVLQTMGRPVPMRES